MGRFLAENNQKHTRFKNFYWSIFSSVTGLLEVLEEETGNDRDRDTDHGIDRSHSPISESNDGGNDVEDEQENEHRISDAEALLACWSYLKRRKRLGDWNDYKERQAQNRLSQNYFLIDDEEGDIILDEDEDDDDDREAPVKFEGADNDLIFDNNIDKHNVNSFTTVQDILSGSSPIRDKHRLDDDCADDDDIAEDLKTISNFVSDTGGAINTERSGIRKRRDTKDIDLWYTEFTSFPKEPSDSRTRRVHAMKRRWEDPAYRERWHEKRWGCRSNHQRKKFKQQTDRERQATQRARALPSGFLGSDELASMTEEEIADAIRTRIRSTHKRVARRKLTLQKRKDVLAAQIKALETLSEVNNDNYFHEDEESLPRDVLFSPSKATLEEAQRKRSERAKNLYASRLKNKKSGKKSQVKESPLPSSLFLSKRKSPARKKGPYYPPKQLTPQDAFLRIENDLDNGMTPTMDDLRLVLEPKRMKNRKILLCRILRDEFNLRGKCIPPISKMDDAIKENLNDANGRGTQHLEFVTHCTIEQLGAFIIRLLEKGRSKL